RGITSGRSDVPPVGQPSNLEAKKYRDNKHTQGSIVPVRLCAVRWCQCTRISSRGPELLMQFRTETRDDRFIRPQRSRDGRGPEIIEAAPALPVVVLLH